MALIRGPFTLRWGDNEITDVEEIEVEVEVDTEDLSTVQGNTYTLDGAYKATVTLTLLGSDLPILAALLPQNHVANGQVMSTGETVNYASGAIDVVPASCDTPLIFNHLDIISCGTPQNVFRLVNARTRIDTVEIDDKIQRVSIAFLGEPESGEAVVQFFKSGTINTIS